MSVVAQPTPNPNAMKFTADSLIFKGDGSVSVAAGQTSEYDIMNDLMKVDGVDNVFGFQNFITINKKMDAEWDAVTPEVEKVFEEHGY
ncbi:NifU N-terminal domain-containing protein [Thalassobacillus hwangdonensis]|uniref:NifU N-terminal domain-containing protein n=1 Tax=Thalassobacillus hwangdonensis TaxID=546108 RepID=A0ABW3KVC5_9BACI